MKKRLAKLISDRWFIGGILLLLQLLLVITLIGQLTLRWRVLNYLSIFISVIMVIWLVRKYDNPAYKISWIIVILLFPLVGGIFYLFWGNTPVNLSRAAHRYTPDNPQFDEPEFQPATDSLCDIMARHAAKSRYIRNITGMPAWGDTSSDYYASGEELFDAMVRELSRAQKFIYLEYFIIERGEMWNTILTILIEKVKAGVDVRVLFDDAGCMGKLPRNYAKYLRSLGIRAVRFNPFIPMLNTYLNYRDHRKICVVDGNVGFMGGINLADEYIGRVERFGVWKDTGVSVKGDGAVNMTLLFLQLWEYTTGEKIPPMAEIRPRVSQPSNGFAQAFADSPLDDENVGEAVYMQIISNARRSVYITTPYLVLDNEMLTTLTVAAKSGIDVRIITPGVPDKKLVYMVTRSYYQQLCRAGVKIYEYTPGFLHAKMIVADDDVGIIGTMNMDFRSFFMHFECGTIFYGSDVLQKAREDIEEIISVSRLIDDDWFRKVPWAQSILASLLRVFAPIL